ncbi:unnamed protein product [Lampetra fluviatilis]
MAEAAAAAAAAVSHPAWRECLSGSHQQQQQQQRLWRDSRATSPTNAPRAPRLCVLIPAPPRAACTRAY